MYRMIIIDDEPEILAGLSNYFAWEELGYTVAGTFDSSRRALEFLRTNEIEVVLSDIKMPRLSGLELARKLCELGHPARIVFVSGYKEFDFLKEALEYRVFNYLLKPVTHAEIQRTFSRLKKELDERASAGAPAAEAPSVIASLKQYIDAHFSTTSLEDAAAQVHLNPNYLSKYFKAKTGENFSDYLKRVKMNKAVELMHNHELKNYHISEMVGYTNPNNFTRAFKKLFGKSPKDYRNA